MVEVAPTASVAAAEPAESATVLFESDRTRVSRILSSAGGPSWVLKQPLGPRAGERTAHERRILQRLSAVQGVARLAETQRFDGLALQDDAGETLAAALAAGGAFDVDAWLALALGLTQAVGGLHRAGVMHKDINPANILVVGGGAPVLIDFDLATTSAEERPRFVHHRQIVGTFPYLAPEQTGRTGGTLDERADLYALGATLYEAASGQPPFASQSPLQVLHDVLTRVPTPLDQRDGRFPGPLSRIVDRLLEKEPDRRYQSAEGLERDLSALLDARRAGNMRGAFELGRLDFPLRLLAPSHLIGRQDEIAALTAAFEESLTGDRRGLFVTGSPGVGKTALVDGLRREVTARGGWLVSGKFDAHRHDAEANAVHHALRAVGRLLLAGSDAEVATARSRLTAELGGNTGLAAAALPEFAALLDEPPEKELVPAGDSDAAAHRLDQMGLDVLRAVASTTHPLVIVLDDLQWAAAVPVGFVDAVLNDESLRGVLLVGIYRGEEVDATHPLTAALARWRGLLPEPAVLTVNSLAPVALGDLLADMLRLPSSQVSDLAAAICERTGGNPYDTVEVVNELRREGALVVGSSGWTWDVDEIRRFVGQGDIIDLLAIRLSRLPDATRKLVEIVAYLGGDVPRDLLGTAAALTRDEVDERLAPALESGLVLQDEADGDAVRLRHDRVQQAAHSMRAPGQRGKLHLSIARRLQASGLAPALAAGQFLAGAEAIRADQERRVVAELFVDAAKAVRVLNSSEAEHYLTAATGLLDAAGSSSDDPLMAEVQLQRHGVLYRLGRLGEADELYTDLTARTRDPIALLELGCVQVDSLSIRGRPADAVALGLGLLRGVGVDVPEGDLTDSLRRWRDDLVRRGAAAPTEDFGAGVLDRRTLLAGRLITRLLPASFFLDPWVSAGLALANYQLLIKHGLSAPLVANLGSACITVLMIDEDYPAAYATGRYAIALADAGGYDHEAAWCHHMFSLCAQHWLEPLENSVEPSQRAREELVRHGDLNFACFTHFISLAALLDCSPTLDGCANDVEAALAFTTRTGNEHAAAAYVVFRQLVRALRGETSGPGSFTDDSFDEAEHLGSLAANPMAAAYVHIYRALSAALMGDPIALAEHGPAAVLHAPYIVGFYPVALAHVLNSLSHAHGVRTATGSAPARAAHLSDLDISLTWLQARSSESPDNFAHLATWVAAERAWAVGDLWDAARLYDDARRQVAQQRRPWHQALITERAALFHLDAGLEHAGRDLLREARAYYVAWSATGKVTQLDHDHPFLTAVASLPHRVSRGTSSHGSGSTSSDEIELLAILHATQILSSETDPDQLRARVGELLGAMTGADTIMIALRDDQADEWTLWDTVGGSSLGVPLDAESGQLAPLTVLRYVQRTLEPLLLDDAGADSRFADDPYLAGLTDCSLLAMPVAHQGDMRAVLVLENRSRKAAFAASGLEAVMLITGQLAVSLDNAQLYASLERKVRERTIALEDANRALEVLSTTDALTQLPNRRHFDITLDAECRRAVRDHTPIAVAMIDVDHFKRYNDGHGHPAGDVCLRLVAAALRDELRAVDTACRYGGEEFAVVLPGADRADGLLVAERMRAAVEALTVAPPDGLHSRVTISIGVAACLPDASTDSADLVATADRSLYEAKSAGRNTVRSSPARQRAPEH